MSAFSVLHLPAEVLTALQLPLFRYEVPKAYSDLVKIDPFNPPLEAMLYCLQERAADGRSDWEGMAGPMQRLTELLCKTYSSVGPDIQGESWWVTFGNADIFGDVITIQRGEHLQVAFGQRMDGRLDTTVFRPLCAAGIQSILNLNMKAHPEHGVAMRENNWEYAEDNAALNGNTYAAMDGRTYMTRWYKGVGVGWDGDVPAFIAERKHAVPRPIELVITEIRAHEEIAALLATAPQLGNLGDEPFPQEYLKANAKYGEDGPADADLDGPPLLSTFYLGTEEGRVEFLYVLYEHYQADGLLLAVNHIWNSLEKPRGVRCAQMAQKVGKTGTGRRALVRFVKSFLDETLYELDVPDLPVRDEYSSFEAWNEDCLSMFRKIETDLSTVIYRYAAIMDGQDAVTGSPPPPAKTGTVIKGPWGRGKKR